jgi:hypothetical protein
VHESPELFPSQGGGKTEVPLTEQIETKAPAEAGEGASEEVKVLSEAFQSKERANLQLWAEVQRISGELKSVEVAHLRTLESWIMEAERWEVDLTLPQIIKAAPFYEAEHRVCILQRRVDAARSCYQQHFSDHEDLTQAVGAVKSKLRILVQMDGGLPPSLEAVHEETCSRLKELSDRFASKEIELDSARSQLEDLTSTFQSAQNVLAHEKSVHQDSSENTLARCQLYFDAKWQHEEQIVAQNEVITALCERRGALLEQIGVPQPDEYLSLADFEVPSATSQGIEQMPLASDPAQDLSSLAL